MGEQHCRFWIGWEGYWGCLGGEGGGGNFGNFGRSERKTWVFEPVQIWSARLGFYTFWKNTPSDPSTPHEPHLGFLPDLFLPPFQTMSTHLGFQTFSKQWVFRPCQTLSASFGFSYVFKNKVFRLFRLLSAPFGLCTLPKKRIPGPSKPCQPHVDLTRCQKKYLFGSFQTAWTRCGFCYVLATWIFESSQKISARVGSHMFFPKWFLGLFQSLSAPRRILWFFDWNVFSGT